MNDLKTLLPKLDEISVLVIGDVILDEYLIGKATRLSREAPVPILEFEARRLIAGGAANPAANVVALGGTAAIIGLIGADAEAVMLRQVLSAKGIDISGLIEDGARPTTVKTRIMATMGLRSPQQVARLDKLSRAPMSKHVEYAVEHAVDQRVRGGAFQAVLFSDYHGGLITPPLVSAARQAAGESAILLTADAQGDLVKYGEFAIVKCNADDARTYLRRDLHTHDEFGAAAVELCRALKLTDGMVITRGADGATIGTPDGTAVHCPTPEISDVYDTVGAGDTSIAVMTMAAAAGASLENAVRLANIVSGIVVRHVGNYTPTPDEVARELDANN